MSKKFYCCTFDDRIFHSYQDYQKSECRAKNHRVESFESSENSENQYVRYSNNGKITKTILDKRFKDITPITYFSDTKERMILVYLPTKKETTKKQNTEKENTEIDYANTAYFIRCLNSKIGKEITPSDDQLFTNNYKTTILPEWNNVRWNYDDITKWKSESEKTDPKLVYDLLNQTTRKYIEFETEAEFVRFIVWNIGTYFHTIFDSYPIFDFTGTKRSGKSKNLAFQSLTCFNGFVSGSMTPSSLFRIREGTGATICIDETEQFSNKNNTQAQDLRTLLLQCHIKHQFAVRVEKSDEGNFTTRQFNLFGPTSLGHISSFDDVLDDRCIPQVNKRALNKKILDSWPDNSDSSFEKIRGLCYRLFLDYADEIYELRSEAQKFLNVSGREQQLWKPLMVMALFFQKHGVAGLIDQIKQSSEKTRDDRQLQDEQENYDYRILAYLDELRESLQADTWLVSKELYDGIIKESKHGFTEHNLWLKSFTATLRRLGLKSAKKHKGISWLITSQKIDENKIRLGLKSSSFDSPSSPLGTKTPDLPNLAQVHSSSPSSPSSFPIIPIQAQNERSERNERSEEEKNNSSSPSSPSSPSSSDNQYAIICKSCNNAGPFRIKEDKKTFEFHKKHELIYLSKIGWFSLYPAF